jgi:ribosomal protein S18 acetylase RimI-like enzyme
MEIASKIKIRNYLKTDCSFVHKLARTNMEYYIEKHWGNWDEIKFKANLKKENLKIVKFNEKIIGYYNIEAHRNILYLHDIQIIKSFQGKGLGKYLMKSIENYTKKKGLKKIKFKVFNENPAKLFYKKLGYKIIGKNNILATMEKVF